MMMNIAQTMQTQTQIYLLERSLKKAHTYESVLSLKDDICRLIIKFNELDKSSDRSSPVYLQQMRTSIKNIRDQYKIKMQALKNPGPYPLVKFLPNELAREDLHSDLVPTLFEDLHVYLSNDGCSKYVHFREVPFSRHPNPVVPSAPFQPEKADCQDYKDVPIKKQCLKHF